MQTKRPHFISVKRGESILRYGSSKDGSASEDAYSSHLKHTQVKLAPLLALLLALGLATTALAHGAEIEYTLNTTVEVQAAYDSGEPMDGGQVTVYAPDDPSTPWLTGVCDQQGRFSFTPDPALPGTWDVQVRQAGHGDIIHIPIGAGAASSSSGGYTTSQIVLMGACVIWGFAGTALFFSRKPGPQAGDADAHS